MNTDNVTIYLPSGIKTFEVGTDGIVRILTHGSDGVSIYTSIVQPICKVHYANVAYSVRSGE